MYSIYYTHNIQVLTPFQVSMYFTIFRFQTHFRYLCTLYTTHTIFRFQTHFKCPCTPYTSQYSGFNPTSGIYVLYILHNIQVSNLLQVSMYILYYTIFRFQTHFRNIHVLYILHNIQVLNPLQVSMYCTIFSWYPCTLYTTKYTVFNTLQVSICTLHNTRYKGFNILKCTLKSKNKTLN